MGSNTNFDPTGEKKHRKKATLKGAIISGVVNAMLGVVLAFVVLAGSPPTVYDAKPDAKSGKPQPLPAGLFYWTGAASGDFQAKESLVLADKPGSVTLTGGELNSWVQATFKSAGPPVIATAPVPKPKHPASTNALAKVTPEEQKEIDDEKAAELKATEAELESFGFVSGTPNFNIFHDPEAPDSVKESFQISMPMYLTVMGQSCTIIYQARGVFVPGAQGPVFKPYFTSYGSARVPVAPGFAQMVFNACIRKFAASPDAKKYVDAWGKFDSATVQDGALVLAAK